MNAPKTPMTIERFYKENAPDRLFLQREDGCIEKEWTGASCGNDDVEYIRADIHEAQIDTLKAENANLEFLLQHVIGDHCAPNDCYATGPLTGNPIADLVSCPSCAALDYLASKEKK